MAGPVSPERDSKRGTISQQVSIVRTVDKRLNLIYYTQYYCPPIIQHKIMDIQVGISREGLSKKNMERLPIPMPPLVEQNRIVERLEKLLPEIDILEIDESKLDVLQKAFPKKMKDSILQYAVEGKLTEQLPSDGDAHELLKEVQKEKYRLIKEGKIKKEKSVQEITENEIPFDIPENWSWARLNDLAFFRRWNQAKRS